MTAGSLPWCAKPLLSGWRGERMRWSHVMRRDRHSGVWMPSLRRLKRWVSRLNAARSGASICAKEYAGVTPIVGGQFRSRFCPKRTAVVCHYTQPPQGSTTVCTDELGPVVPRTFPPAPGWSPTGHRIKAPLDYSRGPEKTWVYGALRVRDGKELTRCAASRNSTNCISLL